MPNRPRGRRPARRAVHGAHQLHQPRPQHLQGAGDQRRAEHPGRLHRLRPGPQRLPAHLRPDADLLRPARARASRSASARRWPAATARPSSAACAAATTSSSRSSRRASAPRARPSAPTCRSPGGMLVMMPGMESKGVSRKIEDDAERRRLKQILDSLQAAQGRRVHPPHRERRQDQGRDRARLQVPHPPVGEHREEAATAARARSSCTPRATSSPAPCRDLFTQRRRPDRGGQQARWPTQIQDVIKLSNPRTKNKVELYDEPVPMFHKFGIEREIELMYSRHVPLPSGG